MTDNVFSGILVADPYTFRRAANSSVTVYDVQDVNDTTPLALEDLNGIALPNPLTSSSDAFLPDFRTNTPHVKLVAANGLTLAATSIQAVIGEATDAKEFVKGIGISTTNTVAAGIPAAVRMDASGQMTFDIPAGLAGAPGKDGSNVLPTDAGIGGAVDTIGSITNSALVKRYRRAKAPLLMETRYLYQLGAWKTALAAVRAGTRDAKILCIGDSTTEGFKSGASDFMQRNSWTSVMADALDARLVPTANGLAIPPGSQSNSPADNRWTTTGTVRSKSTSGFFGVIGFGGLGASYIIDSQGGTVTFNDPRTTADTFDVYLVVNASLTSTYSVQATGGAAVSGSTYNGSSGNAIRRVTVTAGSAGAANSVTVTKTDSSTTVPVIVVGVEPSLSTTRKVRVGNAGLSSSSSLTWTAYPSSDPNWTNESRASIKAYAPDLTIIDLGINDSNPGAVTSAATFRSKIQELIVTAKLSGDVLVKVMIPVKGREAGQASLLPELRTLGVPLVDTFAFWGSWEEANALGFMADWPHPNKAGHADIGAYMAAALLSA